MHGALGDMRMMADDDRAVAGEAGGRFRSARARSREIARARRHSRVVRILKFVLPVLALLIVAGAWAQIYVSSRLAGLGFGLDAAMLTRDGLAMEKPHITGTSAQGHRFEIEAARAVQDISNPRVVTFENPRATVTLPDGSDRFEVSAGQGRYDMDNETLILSAGVRAKSGMGYEAALEGASIDLRAGTLGSDRPVEVRLREGAVNSRSVQVGDSGDTIRFQGGVNVTIDAGNLRADGR